MVDTTHIYKGSENNDVILTNDFACFFNEGSSGLDNNFWDKELYIYIYIYILFKWL